MVLALALSVPILVGRGFPYCIRAAHISAFTASAYWDHLFAKCVLHAEYDCMDVTGSCSPIEQVGDKRYHAVLHFFEFLYSNWLYILANQVRLNNSYHIVALDKVL